MAATTPLINAKVSITHLLPYRMHPVNSFLLFFNGFLTPVAMICTYSRCQRSYCYPRAISLSPWRPPSGRYFWCRCLPCKISSTWSQRIITTDYLKRCVCGFAPVVSQCLFFVCDDMFVVRFIFRLTSLCVALCQTCYCCPGPACQKQSSSGRAVRPITRDLSTVLLSSTASCPAHQTITTQVRPTESYHW